MENNSEIWKPVVGYEGLYEVSDMGNIRNIKRNKILSLSNDKNGYKLCTLFSANSRKMFRVHRIVARAYPEICGEWFDNCQIDHKNTICGDNRANNLKVCTPKENCSNPITMLHRRLNPVKYWEGKKGKNHIKSKTVLQYDINLNFIREYGGVREASRETRCDRTSIGLVCQGKRKTCGGFIWKYKRTA